MTEGKKLALALLLLEYLANEQMTHHERKMLANIALQLIAHSTLSPNSIYRNTEASDIPF